MPAKTELARMREKYHREIGCRLLGYRTKNGEPTTALSNADSSSANSKLLAEALAKEMGCRLCTDVPTGQATGTIFATLTSEFVKECLKRLQHVRPATWAFSTSQALLEIARFDQYRHLREVDDLINENKEFKAILGTDYLVTPDILVSRSTLSDTEINASAKRPLVDGASFARFTPTRGDQASSKPILHATISCKWTMRSDRSQNTRTEALNLIRNRKGRVPHIAAVTMEPWASRIASIALGTGDIDCTYHAALHELVAASEKVGNEDQLDLLSTMIDGRRLRDISDLPFDLVT